VYHFSHACLVFAPSGFRVLGPAGMWLPALWWCRRQRPSCRGKWRSWSCVSTWLLSTIRRSTGSVSASAGRWPSSTQQSRRGWVLCGKTHKKTRPKRNFTSCHCLKQCNFYLYFWMHLFILCRSQRGMCPLRRHRSHWPLVQNHLQKVRVQKYTCLFFKNSGAHSGVCLYSKTTSPQTLKNQF